MRKVGVVDNIVDRRDVLHGRLKRDRGSYGDKVSELQKELNDALSRPSGSVKSTTNVKKFGRKYMREYKLYQKNLFQPYYVAPMALLMFANVASRGNLSLVGSDGKSSFLFTAAFVAMVVAAVAFSFFFAASLIVQYSATEVAKRSKAYLFSKRVLDTWFFGRIEDFIGIFGTIFGCLTLIGRITAGECAPGVSIWDSQQCNPVAMAGSMPSEQILLMNAYPIVCQAVLKGISIEAVCMQYILVLISEAYCVISQKVGHDYWTVLLTCVFFNVLLEFETRMRMMFMQCINLEESKEREKDLAIEIAAVSAENEHRLAEAEKQQLRSLLGNVAHDLKTPLHSFAAELEILRSVVTNDGTYAPGSAKEIADICNSMESTSKFMLMAINRGLDFVKASSNVALVPANETFQVIDAIHLAMQCVERVQTGRRLVMHDFPSSICSHVITDKHWLMENVMCLMSNATKYSDVGAIVDLKVELMDDKLPEHLKPCEDAEEEVLSFKSRYRQLTNENEPSMRPSKRSLQLIDNKLPCPHVLVVVEDTGIGIADDVRRNLFRPFKQAQRLAGGTGLGLYSLSKRVEALGGLCGVGQRNDGHRGSMFWFTFPYRPDHSAARQAAEIIAPSSTSVSRMHTKRELISPDKSIVLRAASCVPVLKGECILLVDDTMTILKVTSRTLKMNGYTVVTAENGSQALEKMKAAYATGSIGLVLTDLQMPVMDGMECVRRYREFEAEENNKTETRLSQPRVRGNSIEDDSPQHQKHLVIIGMSANSDSQTAEDAIKSGMDGFVGKPFNYEDFENKRLKALAVMEQKSRDIRGKSKSGESVRATPTGNQ